MNFLDWQFARFTSPAVDLLHIIFSCTDKAFRDNEYHNLLNHYHRTLTKMTEKLGNNTAEVFTIDDLYVHMRKFGYFAIFSSVLMIPIILADAEDVPDLDELGERLGNDDAGVNFVNNYNDAKQAIYEKRIRDVIEDLYNLEFYVMPQHVKSNEVMRNGLKMFLLKLVNRSSN